MGNGADVSVGVMLSLRVTVSELGAGALSVCDPFRPPHPSQERGFLRWVGWASPTRDALTGGTLWELENGYGVHRRAGPPDDNQRVDAQHELVPALFRAYLGQRLQKGIVQQRHPVGGYDRVDGVR